MMPMMALAVFFCGVGTGVAEALAQKTKPNFVVIFIDDMGYGDIEPFGSQQNNPLSPPCIPPNPGFRDLPAKSKFLAVSR